MAEERRLLYVGITRAREHLQLSYSRARHPRARASRGVSRFLTDLWPDERRRPTGPRRDLDDRQQEVVHRLTVWRDAHAVEVRRQPASVLTTATIRAIAERCPGTLEELGSVRGVGPTTLAGIGEDVLATVRAALQAPVR